MRQALMDEIMCTFATGYAVVFEKHWLIIFKESFTLKAALMNNCKLKAMLQKHPVYCNCMSHIRKHEKEAKDSPVS